jgi:hypothetical protein
MWRRLRSRFHQDIPTLALDFVPEQVDEEAYEVVLEEYERDTSGGNLGGTKLAVQPNKM